MDNDPRRRSRHTDHGSRYNNFRPLMAVLIVGLFNWLPASGFSAGSGSRQLPRISNRARWQPPTFSTPRFPHHDRSYRSSATGTELHMVMTLPTEIIENVTTQNLLDDLINETVRTSARKTIMMQFDPSSGWIWRRWSGTVFSETWGSCVRNMVMAVAMLLVLRMIPGSKKHLQGFSILWGQLLSVTTFTLTFFVNQSYALWRKCYELSRRLQGRLNDLGMTLAAHAARKEAASPYEPAQYTDASKQLLELVGRYIRLFNLLTYASFTRSHRPVLTPRGMTRMVERGLMTAVEKQVLVDAEVSPTQRHNAVILWIMRCFKEGCKAGHFQGGDGFEQQFLEKAHVIRSQYGAIGDELQGRMPLAYAHLVQVLVDTVLWMYPVMAFATDMTPFLGVVGTGILTMSYQGLFELAKHFLDPYDNENYGRGDDPLCVDTLIAETNSGSVRWMNSFAEMPFSAELIQRGKLQDSLLPLRGYTVEEATRNEEERRRKEMELIAQLEKEAEETAAAAALTEGADASIEHSAEESVGTTTSQNATEISVVETEVPFVEQSSSNLTLVDRLTEPTFALDQDCITAEEAVHKVYQLEDGSPVSIVRRDEVDTLEPEPEPSGFEPVSPNQEAAAIDGINGESIQVSGDATKQPLEEEVEVKGSASEVSNGEVERTEQPVVDSSLSVDAAEDNVPNEDFGTAEPDRGSMYIEANPELAKPLTTQSEPQEEVAAPDDDDPSEGEHAPVDIQSSLKPGPKTLEDFKREADQRREELQEELRATMEILSAPPNYDNFDPEEKKQDKTSVDECALDDPECIEEQKEDEIHVENLPEIASQILAEVEAEKKAAEEEAAKAQEELDKRLAIDGELNELFDDERQIEIGIEGSLAEEGSIENDVDSIENSEEVDDGVTVQLEARPEAQPGNITEAEMQTDDAVLR